MLLCAGRELDVGDFSHQATREPAAAPDSDLPLGEQVRAAADALDTAARYEDVQSHCTSW